MRLKADSMDRRDFLRLAASALVLPLERLWLGVFGKIQPAVLGGSASRLLGLLRDRASAVAVGKAYGVHHALEMDAARLAAWIESRLALGTQRLPQPELRERLQAAIREDFAQGSTVDVYGWMLSATEARLCALAALEEAR